ncbi:MAG: transcriptional regulator, MarR family, partial [Tardiphaga sp.]|nr:transcriptional regulator, MarR family [Tardiphaga sp.]
KDARKVINALTPAGAALLDSMVPRARQISEMTLKNLNAVERTALIYTLRSMLDSDD